jgi:hypothetical protein
MKGVLGLFYDLRSKYLHVGENVEFKVKNCFSNKGYARSPAIVQMERISRYVLYKIFEEITERN